MGRDQKSVSDGVRAVILGLLIIILLVAGNDTLLALVAGLAPLAFSGRESAPEQTTADELDDFRDRLHVVQSDAWRRRRPGRRTSRNDWWGMADVPGPRIELDPVEPDRDPENLLRKEIRRVQARLRGARPGPHAELPADEVLNLLRVLVDSPHNLVLQGPEDSGKTGTLYGFVLAAQQRHDNAEADFPLPVRVSLAGWADHWSQREPDRTPSLIDWIKVRFREDYPGLLEHGDSADALLDALWREDIRTGGNTLILFIDDLDKVPVPQVPDLVSELGNRTVLMTCRLPEPHTGRAYEVSAWPGRWETLKLAKPTEVDAREFLGVDLELPTVIQRSPRLLMTLRSAYPDVDALSATVSGLRDPDRQSVDWLWRHLISEGWPKRPGRPHRPRSWFHRHVRVPVAGRLGLDVRPRPPDTSRTFRTLAWVTQAGLFRNTRFAWWEVPRLAAEREPERNPRTGGRIRHEYLGRGDPLVTAAYRRVRRHRAGLATRWAAATFGICLVVLLILLKAGVVQGYDRAGHGLQAAGGVTPADVSSWTWLSRSAPVSNPVYLALLILLLVGLTVFGLARFGDEFEHKHGGRPQIIEPRVPGGRELREVLALVPPLSSLLLMTGFGLAGIFQVTGSGPAAQLWAGSAFSALFVGLLAWLHWCSREGDNLSPADTFDSDRRSARVVAITLGLAATGSSTVLSWWFTSPQHVPTLGQCLWISAAAATSVGLARGIHLGAGMIAPILFPLRPGFGIGYARRMQMLEESLRRYDGRRARNQPDRPADQAAPLSVIAVFDLDRSSNWDEERRRGLVLRQIGSLIRLRDASLENYLRRMTPEIPPGPARPSAPGPGRRRRRRVAVVLATTTALLSLTGTAAVVAPRLFCTSRQDLSPLRSWNRNGQTWLENGQCVGYETLTGGGSRFSAMPGPSGGPEAERTRILRLIERQNAAIPDSQQAVDILFLAPLSRTPGSGSINALYQLEGAQRAQAAINEQKKAFVRLLVANVGENFTSGPAVVQTLNRKFSADRSDPGSIKAVIGVAQSRAAARRALAEFHEVPIVAGAVNGNDMRHGLVLDQDVDLHNWFVSVAPSNRQVARAMLSATVLRKATASLGPNQGVTTVNLRVIRDDTDTYFSNDLANSLTDVLKQEKETRPFDLRETDSDERYRELATQMCGDRNRRTVWLFAGRGNQLDRLDHALTCAPSIIAGPGALSMIQSGAAARSEHLVDLLFYSLTDRPAKTLDRTRPGWATALARGGDVSTGWAALVEAYRKVIPASAVTCPADTRGVVQIGISIDQEERGDGHNTLDGPPTGCGRAGGSAINLCSIPHPDHPGTCLAVRDDDGENRS